MSPHTSTGDNVTTGGIPVDVRDTVVLDRLHQLKVGSQILLTLGLLTLEIHIPEINVEARLRVNRGNNNEATLGRPVDGVARLLLNGAHKLEVTGRNTLLLGSEEGNSRLRGSASTAGSLTVRDENETSSIRLPGEVDHGILETVNNLDRNTLLANAENLQVGGHGLLGLGVTIHLHTDVGTL